MPVHPMSSKFISKGAKQQPSYPIEHCTGGERFSRRLRCLFRVSTAKKGMEPRLELNIVLWFFL